MRREIERKIAQQPITLNCIHSTTVHFRSEQSLQCVKGEQIQTEFQVHRTVFFCYAWWKGPITPFSTPFWNIHRQHQLQIDELNQSNKIFSYHVLKSKAFSFTISANGSFICNRLPYFTNKHLVMIKLFAKEWFDYDAVLMIFFNYNIFAESEVFSSNRLKSIHCVNTVFQLNPMDWSKI